MDVAPASVERQFVLVYFNNIVTFPMTPEKRIDNVKRVLILLSRAGIILKLKSFFFFTDTIDYPALVIRSRRLEIAAHTADAIQKLKQPHNTTKQRSFPELCNVIGRYDPGFARVAAPLNYKV